MDDPGYRRYCLLQDLQPLGFDFDPRIDADTGDVASGAREIRHQPTCNWIPRDHDDRYLGGGRHEGFDEIVEVRNDDIRIAAHDFGSERRKAVGSAFGRKTLDDEVASLDIAKTAQGFEEPPHPEWPGLLCQVIGRNAGMSERDPVWLRLRAQRLRPGGDSPDGKPDKLPPLHSSPQTPPFGAKPAISHQAAPNIVGEPQKGPK